MDIAFYFIGEQSINEALALNTVHPLKCCADDGYIEMTFAFGPRSGMAMVARRFVTDF